MWGQTRGTNSRAVWTKLSHGKILAWKMSILGDLWDKSFLFLLEGEPLNRGIKLRTQQFTTPCPWPLRWWQHFGRILLTSSWNSFCVFHNAGEKKSVPEGFKVFLDCATEIKIRWNFVYKVLEYNKPQTDKTYIKYVIFLQGIKMRIIDEW